MNDERRKQWTFLDRLLFRFGLVRINRHNNIWANGYDKGFSSGFDAGAESVVSHEDSNG